ncbi:uncharacterized protein TEOVI_000911100 [Trypanosoma equiperdum]|uniref:Phospholipid/glycerol acyltransferase domain-containing protein n=2 Tax=Trypanozoon TaxID=39700 RepID=Q382T1_TRYB2|nr:hypothetical protein, conserved [Trypanosoma brucei brucei TREU927]EAN80200.1 hypothetical protein, conserved [Trypanosoma brucei brucei TREU927]SCU68510.1 hypothetical protein, conserved [Trypanosoma equiperdum]
MEKYRKFGDAATGINPFISMKTPTAFSTLFAAVLFPVRCVIAVVIMSLLFLVDTFNYLFYLLPGLSSLSHLLFGGLQRGLLRGLLFSLGNVSIARVPTSGSLSPSAGDVVVANLQSVWDMCVIEVAEQIPLFVAAFYGGKAGSSPEKSKKDEDGTLFVMKPSPLQRWRVWWHIYNTGTSTFLSTVADDSSNAHSGEALPIDITLLQRRCHRLGVPLVLFAEGSCTNGKGMLNISPIRVGVTPARLLVSALSYDTAALHTVVRPHSVLSYLFSMSASLYGSRDPAWYSPQFPTATARLASVGTDPPAEAVEGVVVVEGTKVRQVLCGISRPRCALNVGLREKRRFVEVFMAQ